MLSITPSYISIIICTTLKVKYDIPINWNHPIFLNVSSSHSLQNINGVIENKTKSLYIHNCLPLVLLSHSYIFTIASSIAKYARKYTILTGSPPKTRTITNMETVMLYHLRGFSKKPSIRAPARTNISTVKKYSPEKKLITTILLNIFGLPFHCYS